MVNKKLITIYDRERVRLGVVCDQKDKVVQEVHGREGFSPAWKKAVTLANDARDYRFAYVRSRTLRGRPEKVNSAYLLDLPHHAEDLSRSAILDLLKDVPADELKIIIADMVLFNRGLIDSAIDMLEGTVKSDKEVKVKQDGTTVPVSGLQNYFRYVPDENREYHPSSKRRSIASSLNKILMFHESQKADAMESSQIPGGAHPLKRETLEKRLKKWVIREWESTFWSSQDDFIKRIREPAYAPNEKFETLGWVEDPEIKGWLTVKKKYVKKK